MLKQLKKLPVGIENFREIRQDNFYYVDKTKLIEQLLTQWGKVNLLPVPPFWKIHEYEYAESLFLRREQSWSCLMACIFLEIVNYARIIWAAFQ